MSWLGLLVLAGISGLGIAGSARSVADGPARVRRTVTLPRLFRRPIDGGMTVTSDGLVLASVGRPGLAPGWRGRQRVEPPREVIHLDEVETGVRGATIEFAANFGVINVGPLAVSPDGATVAIADWDRLQNFNFSRPAQVIRVWKVDGCRELAVLAVGPGQGRHLGFTPDGKILLVTLRSSPNVERVERWSTEDWSPGPRSVVAVASESRTAIAPDGQTLVEGSVTDASIKVRDVASGNLRSVWIPPKRFDGSSVCFNLLFSPDGLTLAVGRLEGVELWDVPSGTWRLRLPAIKLGSRGRATMAFSNDGRRLAVAGSISLNDRPIDRMVRWLSGIFPINVAPLVNVGLVSVVDVASGRLERSFEIANQQSLSAIGFALGDQTIVTEGYEASRTGSRFRADPTHRIFWDWAARP